MIHNGDCLAFLKTLAENSVDSIVTDPPYGLSFMGKRWDYDVPSVEIWAECLRVLKPGGHLLAFAGTRTQHRMAVRIEDAGFEIRDMIAWVYGSGFPKSLDVSKAIDKAAGAEREVVGVVQRAPAGSDDPTQSGGRNYRMGGEQAITAPATEAAQQWQGWGTALKPALEPITVARKPLEGTVAANVLAHGTGALNIDGCRVEHTTVDGGNLAKNPHLRTHINGGNGGNIIRCEDGRRVVKPNDAGRWPANLIHDGSDEVRSAFPDTKGQQGALSGDEPSTKTCNTYGVFAARNPSEPRIEDDASAARFFYCAKASKKDRGEGNNHPTVKPTDLMRYLCRLVTPVGGTVLDPFMGSGSTGKAAVLEGFRFIGCEMENDYVEVARKRILSAMFEVLK